MLTFLKWESSPPKVEITLEQLGIFLMPSEKDVQRIQRMTSDFLHVMSGGYIGQVWGGALSPRTLHEPGQVLELLP